MLTKKQIIKLWAVFAVIQYGMQWMMQRPTDPPYLWVAVGTVALVAMAGIAKLISWIAEP